MAKKPIVKSSWYILTETKWTSDNIRYTAKPTLKLCTEWSWANKKLVLLRNGVRDCIPFPELSWAAHIIAYYEDGADSGIELTAWASVTRAKTWNFQTVTPTPNTVSTITHNLNSTRIQVVAYDVATGEQVDVEVKNRTANSVDIISSTIDALDIVIKK